MQTAATILQPYASASELHALLDACIGRLARRDGDYFVIEGERLRHIVDWLRAALANNEPWLKNVDDQGRPKKLMKFGSVDAILHEADKAMLKAAQRLKGVKLVDGDEEFVEMLDDGFYVVRLLTPAALDRESGEMQHCIGDGAYDRLVESGLNEYFSLRDQVGRPHATMEVKSGELTQLQGKQNAVPVEKYRNLLIPFIASMKWDVKSPEIWLGYVVDVDGEWHSICELPTGLEVKGDLDFRNSEFVRLPVNLKVGGDLYIARIGMTTLPAGLVVEGNFFLMYSEMMELPKGLVVGGSLQLEYTRMKSLPEGLKVGGNLYLTGTDITELPADIEVRGGIALEDTKIKTLPEGLKVGKFLSLMGTKIEALPAKLEVGTDLYLHGSKIKKLPKDMKVGGKIFDSMWASKASVNA